MHIRDQKTHKLKVHRIPTNTPQKRVTSYGSRRDHCIDNQKRERGSHLASNYGPVGLQRTTHASRRGTNGSGEPLRDGV